MAEIVQKFMHDYLSDIIYKNFILLNKHWPPRIDILYTLKIKTMQTMQTEPVLMDSNTTIPLLIPIIEITAHDCINKNIKKYFKSSHK